jgi:uncharacterized membrane protein YkoI
MIRKILLALAVGTAIAVFGPHRADAQACLSQDAVRVAVQNGQAVPLSSVLDQIRAQVGGEILPNPSLCDYGGRLIYIVNVLSDAQVTRVQVDARTGSISY